MKYVIIAGGLAAVDDDLRRRGMKRYVPSAAMAENCDLENHRSKLRVQPDERTTEDESENDSLRSERSGKRYEDKEVKKGDNRSKETDGKNKDHGREERSDKTSRTSDRDRTKDAEQQTEGKANKDTKLEKPKRLGADHISKESKRTDDNREKSKKYEDGSSKDCKHGTEKIKSDRKESDRNGELRKDAKSKSREIKEESKLKHERNGDDQKAPKVKEMSTNHVSLDANQEEPITIVTCPVGDDQEVIPKMEPTEKELIIINEESIQKDLQERKSKRDDEKASNRTKEHSKKEKPRDGDHKVDHTHRDHSRSSTGRSHDHKSSYKSSRDERSKSEHKRKGDHELTPMTTSVSSEVKKRKFEPQTEEKSLKPKLVNSCSNGTC